MLYPKLDVLKSKVNSKYMLVSLASKRASELFANPETKRDIDTRNPVVSKSNFNAELMISGGVIMATKIANKCCRAAKIVSRIGGRSFRP